MSASPSNTAAALRAAEEERDAAQEEYDRIRELYEQTMAARAELEAAREALERAIQALYEAIEEAINELQAYIDDIRYADAERARKLMEQLENLRYFQNHLSEIKNSFGDIYTPLTNTGISSLFNYKVYKTGVKSTLDWVYVRNILQLPYGSIRLEQFETVAQFLSSERTASELERFFRAIAEPVVFGNDPNVRFMPTGNDRILGPHMGGPNDLVGWAFCINKLGGINLALTGMALDTLNEMLLPASQRTEDIDVLRKNFDQMLQGSALLFLAASIHTTNSDGDRRIMAGSADGPLFHITDWTSSDGRFTGFGIDFISIDHRSSTNHPDEHIANVQGNRIIVSDAQNSLNIRNLLDYNTQNTISNQFPIDIPLDWSSPALKIVAKEWGSAVIGAAGWKVSLPVTIGQETIGIFTGNTAERRANQEINDIVGHIIADGREGSLYSRFGFRTVVINSGTTNQQLMAWPSDITQNALNGMNHVIDDRLRNEERDIRDRRAFERELHHLGLSYPLDVWDAISNLDRIDELYTRVFENNDRDAMSIHTGPSITQPIPINTLTPSNQPTNTPSRPPSHGSNHISPE